MQNFKRITTEAEACGYTCHPLMGQRILILKAPGMTIGIAGMGDNRYDVSVHTKENPQLMYDYVTLGYLVGLLDEPLQALYQKS